MEVRFGRADHGWLPVTLETADGSLGFDVSYLPNDFLRELIRALCGVLQGPGEYSARICEEPGEHDWRFRAYDASAAVFDVVTYPEGRDGRGGTVASVWGTPLEVVLPFRTGLDALASRAVAERFRANWTGPFPFAELARLGEAVESAGAERRATDPTPPGRSTPIRAGGGQSGAAPA